jgi:hypothetical protein
MMTIIIATMTKVLKKFPIHMSLKIRFQSTRGINSMKAIYKFNMYVFYLSSEWSAIVTSNAFLSFLTISTL